MRLRARSLSVLLVALALVAACSHPATVVTPAGQKAYAADQIVKRVNELMNTAIQAQAGGGLTAATTRIIVAFCVHADETLAATPAGWGATVATAWAKAKADPLVAPYLTNSYIAVSVGFVDSVLAAYGGVQP